MGDTLVICVGNLARGDDGVARHVADVLERSLPTNAQVVSVPQLDVVMAERIATFDRVVFVDAERRHEPPVRVDAIGKAVTASGTAPGHALIPEAVLGLAGTLYGAHPDAYLVSVAAPEMPHAEGLSPVAHTAAQQAVEVVLELTSDDDR